jgi:hypothetical protein
VQQPCSCRLLELLLLCHITGRICICLLSRGRPWLLWPCPCPSNGRAIQLLPRRRRHGLLLGGHWWLLRLSAAPPVVLLAAIRRLWLWLWAWLLLWLLLLVLTALVCPLLLRLLLPAVVVGAILLRALGHWRLKWLVHCRRKERHAAMQRGAVGRVKGGCSSSGSASSTLHECIYLSMPRMHACRAGLDPGAGRQALLQQQSSNRAGM